MKNTDDTHQRADMEVAVIGMKGRFPGAPSVETLWENLTAGKESITFFSDRELAESGIEPAEYNHPNYVKAGGYLEDADCFDPYFFGYNPVEARIMDPQVRLFHECAWEALENAGYNPGSYRDRIGLYAGAAPGFYWQALIRTNGTARGVDPLALTYLANNDFLSTNIAYRFDLKGPAFTLSSACSTSLTAIHLAVQAILNGECEMALAGGVNLSLPRKSGYLYNKGMIMSPDGHCRAFDAKAEGTVGGEGVGVVVLKLLEDAIDDGDNIHAVVKGSAINNDGAQKVGFTAPGVDGQADAIATALDAAGVEPESIGYVEAHGTGTKLGDPVEIEALKLAYNTDKKQFCGIGSVKSNIGHLNAAAGVTGFIKAVLTLKHRMIPPSLHFETPNPGIDFKNSPFYVVDKLTPWEKNHYPRRAGVSSFGIGGANAHVILQERPRAVYKPRDGESPPHLFLLSAATRDALQTATDNLADYLKNHPDINPTDAAYTLQTGRKVFKYRKSLVCNGIHEAVEMLSTPEHTGVRTFSSGAESPQIVFMFPGQGAQYVNMGRDLYLREPVFRTEMDRCFDLLEAVEAPPFKEILFPADGVGEPDRINMTEVTQPLVFIIEYAAAKYLMNLGIEPAAMIGHSLGEYTAACLAGVFSLEDALALLTLRGKLSQQISPGAMLSVPMSEEEVSPLLTGDLSLAAVNSPSNCVVSGTFAAVDAVAGILKEKGLNCRKLHISHAFHSQMMDPVLKPFEEKLRTVSLNEPQIPYVSNLTGRWITGEDARDPRYWTSHLRRTVRFCDGIKEILTDQPQVFIEAGPGKTLSTLVRQTVTARPGENNTPPPLVTDLIRHPKETVSDTDFLYSRIGQLWLYGIVPDWKQFHRGETRRRTPLPTYPFERRKYPIDGNLSQPQDLENPGSIPASDAPSVDPGPDTAPLYQRPELSADYVEPRTETQKRLAQIWEQLFGVHPVGILDDFFELGGDSLKAMSIENRIQKELQLIVPLTELFNHPTIKELSQYIGQSGEIEIPAVEAVEDRQFHPLSSMQQRLYLLQQVEPESTGYNMTLAAKLTGKIDTAAFEASFNALIARHESLRTSFHLLGGEPVQEIHGHAAFKIDFFQGPEYTAMSPRRIIADFVKPFDLSLMPLMRVGLFQLRPEEHLLVVDVHHIISDAISHRVLIRDFMVLLSGETPAPLKLHYKDYVQWRAGSRGNDEYKNQEDYWMKMLDGELPVLELTTDYPRREDRGIRGDRRRFKIEAETAERLKHLTRTGGVTLQMLLLAVFHILLAKLSGQADIITGATIAGRRRPGLEEMIGLFANTLALRSRPAGDKIFSEYLEEVRTMSLGAYDNQEFPLEKLTGLVASSWPKNRNPLFDILFEIRPMQSMATTPADEAAVHMEISPVEPDTTTANFDQDWVGTETADGIEFTVDYSTDLFLPETIDLMAEQFLTLLESVMEDDRREIRNLDYRSAVEKDMDRVRQVEFNF